MGGVGREAQKGRLAGVRVCNMHARERASEQGEP